MPAFGCDTSMSRPTRQFARWAVLDPHSGTAFLTVNGRCGTSHLLRSTFLVAHLHRVLCGEKGKAFSLIDAHYACAATAAFKEADRCYGTRAAGVVLKLRVVHGRPSPGVLPLDVSHFPSSRELPLAKQKPMARRVSWQSGVC